MADSPLTTTSLYDTPVLALDCQTTGTNAQRHHLVEIGWMVVRPASQELESASAPATHIVKLPHGLAPSRQIEKLTGIGQHHFNNAIEPGDAWQELRKQADAMALSCRVLKSPAVIHFARFEMAFLQKLHETHDADDAFPLEVFCTHQLAARLWPHLPRKGLRAVAGYLGYGVPTLKRCSGHLRATAWIWCRAVEKLDRDHGIRTFDDLRRWMEDQAGMDAIARRYPMPRRIRLSAPELPGIYRFRRSNKDLLYIGKARSLKKRINSYFQTSRRHPEHTLEMLTQAVNLDITTTASALEAALLESDEIKRLHPPYNKALSSHWRDLYFLSRDFNTKAVRRQKDCPLGPVPTAEIFDALHHMGQLVCTTKTDRDAVETGRMLCTPPSLSPQTACFNQGVDLFMAQFGAQLPRQHPWQALIRLGNRSWKEKYLQAQADVHTDDPSADEQAEAGSDQPFEWTPEAVCKTMISILRRCSFLLRRSRWLTMLSESSIAWQQPAKGSQTYRLLIFRKGAISQRQWLTASQPVPKPPGAGVHRPKRQTSLNLETYDRLRVLTTELRRLVAEGRSVSVRLHHRATIGNRHLSRLFKWL